MTAVVGRVLYALVTGPPAARDVGRLVDLALSDGWKVCVIASPDGRRFIDGEGLAAKTGHVVRSSYKEPDAPDILPPADALIVAPVTCNSLAKWAAGISDTLPLGLLAEAVGKKQPVVAMPLLKPGADQLPRSADRDDQSCCVGRDRSRRG
jgi:phosphopantothenoylcysteine synthetase/decarboxylase